MRTTPPTSACRQLKRFTRLAPCTKAKLSKRRKYLEDKAAYLAAHPFCQITILRAGFDEEQVIRDGGIGKKGGASIRIPRAVDVHHRNKRDGDRLLDQRWWISCCRTQHDFFELNKRRARTCGILLPIQADKNGRWGDGYQGVPTAEMMQTRVGIIRIRYAKR